MALASPCGAQAAPRWGGLRDRFAASLGFPLDDFQRRALDALDAGSSVVVAAPTGSGKTAVAYYAVERALAEGVKAFYTTPLKALSNQKFQELVGRHGREAVGLLTGDNVINGDAPVVVMTTEVLRNMIYAAAPALDGLRYVILDEVHYLQNAYRGPVWEEVIIHAPADVDLVCLSATVSNAEELADWIGTVRGRTAAVIEDRRPVELRHLYLIGDRSSGNVVMMPTLVEGRPNPETAAVVSRAMGPPRPAGRGGRPGPVTGGRGGRPVPTAGRPGGRAGPRGRLYVPRRAEVVEALGERGMLPAIYFIFSRAACDDAVGQCLREGGRLTTSAERRQIRAIAEAKTSVLAPGDLAVLDYQRWLSALEAGFAAHHAGLVPPFKEAVEACFGAGLVKVVFATETLSLGINMPARTVVIENLTKWSGERHEMLTAGEYTQLTGRAGRRGIDEVGYAVVLWSPWVQFDQVTGLVGARSYPLRSSFRPTYNMAANLVRRYPPDAAHRLLDLSFAQYRADSDVVHLEAALERALAALAAASAAARCDRGDAEAYLRWLRGEGADRPRGARVADVVAALGRVRPGDVMESPAGRRRQRVVVISTSRRKGDDIRVRAVTPTRAVVSLGPRDFTSPPRPLGRVTLPVPYQPRSPEFVRGAAIALRDAAPDRRGPPVGDGAGGGDGFGSGGGEDGTRRGRSGGGPGAPGGGGWRGPAGGRGHPVAACPDAAAHVRALERVERLEREVARLRHRLAGRAETLARQFDRVLQLLEERGFLDGWRLTVPGERLSRLYHEGDLLVAECLEEGLLDGLGPAELAALVSAFTFEARGGERPASWPGPEVRRRWVGVQEVAARVNADERAASLPLTRPPDPGFMRCAYLWARGADLADLVGDEEIAAGDFVRQVKQVIDLLRQLADVAPDRATAATARRAADRLFRGVVAASAVLEASPNPRAAPS